MRLQVNEGPIDRLIRFLLGVGLFAVAAPLPGRVFMPRGDDPTA